MPTRMPLGMSTVTSFRLFAPASPHRKAFRPGTPVPAAFAARATVGRESIRTLPQDTRRGPVRPRKALHGSRVEKLPARTPRGGTYLYGPVGLGDQGGIVLHHEDGVPGFAQGPHGAHELARVRGVKSRARLVQDVDQARKVAVQPARQLDPLRFATR